MDGDPRGDRELLTALDAQQARTPRERAEANITALAALRDADEDEERRRDALRAYSGWGGCADAFSDKPEWASVRERLSDLLEPDEYIAARASTLTAFYTPGEVVGSMWGELERLGVGRDGAAHILEPGCGTGNFLSTRPSGMGAVMHGVELDPVSARIAAALNPGADVVNADLADTLVTAGSMDAVIGNVPYSGDIALPYRVDGKERQLSLHDYFIERAVDSLRPGGVAMLLTSRHTLDKRSQTVRADLARKAELVAAVRLPGSTFTLQAGTEAVTDVLVLRKRAKTLDQTPDEAWIRTRDLMVPGYDATVSVNELIATDPATHVAGAMNATIGRFGGDLAVAAPAAGVGATLRALLRAQAGTDTADPGPRAGEPLVLKRPENPGVYEYTVDDAGVVWYGDATTVEPVAHGQSAAARRLRGMVAVRDAVRTLQRVELDPKSGDDAIAAARAALNERYDGFVAEFGRLSERANMRAYAHDETSWPLLSSLENTDGNGRFTSLAPVFTRRTLRPAPPMPTHVSDTADAFNISMDRTGRIAPDLIGRLTGMDPAEAVASLGDLAVTDPDTGRPVPADDYLSGDVIAKAEHVRALETTARTSVTREGVRAWRESHHIDEAVPSGAAKADEWLSSFGGVAWASLTDPDGTRSYTSPKAAQARIHDWSLRLSGSRLAVAAGIRMLDEMPHTLTLTAPARPARTDGERDTLHTRAGTGLIWDELVPQPGWSRPLFADPGLPLRDAAIMLDRLTHSDKVTDEDRLAIVTALFECDREWESGRTVMRDSPLGTVLRRIMPDLAGDTRALADAVASDPSVSEYVLATTPDTSAGHERSYQWDGMNHTEATADGLARWREQRARFMAEWRDGYADRIAADETRAGELGRLAERLDRARPLALEADQISMPLGAPWIPAHAIYDFMRHTFDTYTSGITPANEAKYQVEYTELTGQWRVGYAGGDNLSADACERYGTTERNPFQLLEACLNNQQVKITREETDADGRTRRVTDQPATMEVMDRMRAIREAWGTWLDENPAVRQRLAGIYNRRFNGVAPRHVDGSYLTLPGIAEGIHLREHQKNAVARALHADEGTLIAHVVGAGKTFEGVSLVHEAKRLGKANKPMIVVPNHLTGQWAADYMRLYPTAKVLTMDAADTAGSEAARRFWGRVATGDWDAVIVPESRFSQLHVSRARRERNMEARVGQYVDAIEQATRMQGGKAPTVKRLEGARKRVEANLERLRSGKEGRDAAALKGIEFEQLGVDMLFVDEAHHFKNLGVPVASSDLGMQVSSAAKCEDMLDKCELLREQGHGSNIVFATGTPVSNSMSELYNMCRYLAPRLLERQGTASFAAWAGTFGQVVPTAELKPEGTGFQVKQRFARFSNLPELMAGVRQFTDMVTNDQLDLDLPQVEQIPVAVPAEQAQQDAMKRLVTRAEAVRVGTVAPEVDNMLAITSDGRKIALDPKLLDGEADREPLEGGKVEACAANIKTVWERTAAEHGAQLVFCDTSTPAGGGWNIYDDLKRRLVAHGIAADQIAFVHDAGDNPSKREALFAKVRDGRIRVLIGSTAKLSTGTNVQTRLAAIHDLDCPWRPADLEQRLGRIQRQGNMYGHVQAYRYVAEGTFDAYAWQTVERKQRFIAQIMSSATPAREASDLDETVLDYAAIKAIATGDPTIQRRMNLENEVSQLRLLRQAFARRKSESRNDVELRLEPEVRALEATAAALHADADLLKTAADGHRAHMAAGSWEGIDIDGARVYDRTQANHLLYATARAARDGRRIGSYNGVGIIVHRGGGGRVSLTLAGSHEHPCPRDLDAPNPDNPAAGPLPSLERLIRSRLELAGSIDGKLDAARARLEAAERAIERPWEREGEYRDKQRELARLAETADGDGHAGDAPNPAQTEGSRDAEDGYDPCDPSDPTNLCAMDAGMTGVRCM